MKLEERIIDDLKKALKDRDQIRISAIRMLKAAIENLSIEKKRVELKDEDIIKVIRGQVRKYKDSIEQFAKGGRTDLVEKEEAELKVVESYIPQELSPEELEKLARGIISETKAVSKADMGRVMKAMIEQVKGRAEGATISKIVASLLK